MKKTSNSKRRSNFEWHFLLGNNLFLSRNTILTLKHKEDKKAAEATPLTAPSKEDNESQMEASRRSGPTLKEGSGGHPMTPPSREDNEGRKDDYKTAVVCCCDHFGFVRLVERFQAALLLGKACIHQRGPPKCHSCRLL